MGQDTDVLTEAIKEFGQAYPSIIRTLIEERDEYMVCMLRHLASQYAPISLLIDQPFSAFNDVCLLDAC